MTKKLEEYSREELIEEIKSLKRRKKFGLVWEDKKEDIVEKCKNEIPVLKEVSELAINEKPGEPTNLIIEGDNFASLQVLNYTHHGKIDVIYIDPPYNTGNKDFIYNDSYVDSEDSFRHSKWLSFMDRRLRLAKELLSDDGVIFISIDDNEQVNLKLLCDSVFGERNFISLYPRITVKGGKTQTNLTTANCDYILCYAKKRDDVVFGKISMADDPAYKYSDEYESERGKYHTKQMLDAISLGYIQSLDYPIEHNGEIYYPGGTPEKNGYRWTWSRAKFDFAVKNGFVEFRNGRVMPKKYLMASIEKDDKGNYYISYNVKEKNYSQLDFLDNSFSNTNGNNELKKIGISELFSYPKPVSLIKQILKISNKKKSIVLDFFAGSGTTGQAVLELNKEDGGNRKFILCTNNENNIARDVTYSRIKTVVTGIRPDGSKYSDGISANVRYFTTDFIEKGITGDVTRAKLFEKSDEMIQVRENTFEFVDKNDNYTFYKNNEKFVAIIKDPFNFGPIWYELEEKNTEKLPVKLYVFSYSNYTFEDEIPDTDLKYEICAIPNSIMEVYRKISDKKEER